MTNYAYIVVVVQLLSCVQLFVTPWTSARQVSLSQISQDIPEFAQVHVHWIGDAIKLSHPLMPSFPSVFNLSQHQGLFQWVSSVHHMAKVLELQLPHQSFQWIFRVDFPQDWLVWPPWCPRDSHESSPVSQFENINSSALCLLKVQLSHSYMTTGKTIAMTLQTFVGKMMFLLFKTLSRFVIAFLPRSKHLLNSWLHCWSHAFKWKRKSWLLEISPTGLIQHQHMAGIQ